jgi:ligand-binding SRPBCC domain-containing protein
VRVRTLTTEVWLPRPVGQVFGFFADPGNLDALTPPWLHFRIQSLPEGGLRAGARIGYRIRWRLLPLAWRTTITAWEPPHRFVDSQQRGPYRLWVNEHTFAERDGGTLVRDRVDYAVPGGPLEPLLHRLLVGPDVAAIFAYRQAKLREQFGAPGTQA